MCYTRVVLERDWMVYNMLVDGVLIFYRRDIYGSCLKQVQDGTKVKADYIEEEVFKQVWVDADGSLADLKSESYPVLWDLI